MLKVLVADDELIIREGLQSFSWGECGYELVGVAEDGAEALLMTKLQTPDIVITDIKMPIMDGLTLASNIKESYPHICIILLTGYNEMDLVKSALQLHVEDYLLKPTDFDKLKQILHRISRTILTRKNKEIQYKRMTDQLTAALPMLKSNLFEELINGRFFTEQESLNLFSLFEINTGKHMVITTSFQLQSEDNKEDIKEKWLVSMAISNICNEIFSNYSNGVLHYFDRQYLHFLIIFPGDTKDRDCIDAVQFSAKKIRSAIAEFLDSQISFGISSLGVLLTEVHTLRKQSLIAFDHSCFFDSNATILFSDVTSITEINYTIPQGKQEFLDNAIRMGDIKQVKLFWDELSENLSKVSFQNINYTKNIMITTLLQAFRIINEKSDIETDTMDWMQGILECDTYRQLMMLTYEIMEAAITASHQSSLSHYDTIARQIVQYIKEHSFEDLSLDILSENFHFSTAYISRLIRRFAGVNFMEILSETRMEHAKSLLKSGKYKATEISSLVGYRDTSYFIQMFKKRYGITPNEYKNLSSTF